jgi:hypothetical protein
MGNEQVSIELSEGAKSLFKQASPFKESRDKQQELEGQLELFPKGQAPSAQVSQTDQLKQIADLIEEALQYDSIQDEDIVLLLHSALDIARKYA